MEEQVLELVRKLKRTEQDEDVLEYPVGQLAG